MDSKMLLEIENLGLINKANLEIGKINVIVGKNSTGKSTSSKFLFSLLTAASSEGSNLANMDISSRLLNFITSDKRKKLLSFPLLRTVRVPFKTYGSSKLSPKRKAKN